MAKLTKAEVKEHARACDLLEKDSLTVDEREFVIRHWQESARHTNSSAGAFFTPLDMAWSFAIEVGCRRILDLCAGIGVLSYAIHQRSLWDATRPVEITCVEVNPDYVAVGRKVLPEATWIVADALSDLDIGRFDCVVSNPPFGNIQGRGNFDLAVVEQAERYADMGVFILPAGSVPWAYSGRPCFESDSRSEVARRFRDRTQIHLEPGCGIDCSTWAKDWRGVAPKVEIAVADYDDARARRDALKAPPAAKPAVVAVAQIDLFGRAT